jgi:hypothetical protein
MHEHTRDGTQCDVALCGIRAPRGDGLKFRSGALGTA